MIKEGKGSLKSVPWRVESKKGIIEERPTGQCQITGVFKIRRSWDSRRIRKVARARSPSCAEAVGDLARRPKTFQDWCLWKNIGILPFTYKIPKNIERDRHTASCRSRHPARQSEGRLGHLATPPARTRASGQLRGHPTLRNGVPESANIIHTFRP
jgi:hypothetical protein